VISLVLLILFSLPTLVGGAGIHGKQTGLTTLSSSYCNDRGYLNATDGSCTCMNQFYGRRCDQRYCPFGKSWTARPIANHSKNTPYTQCSDNGDCNPSTGFCKCRSMFEGRACERLSCGGTPACSGHGKCRLIREAAEHFDGHTLVRPPMGYSGWEADSIQGCLCDPGYHGYDCSQRSCPFGADPLDSSAKSIETYILECSAYSGSFLFQVKGEWSHPIPYDADAALLRFLLLQMNSVQVAQVTVDLSQEPSGRICGVNDHQVQIQVSGHYGADHPIRVSRNVSSPTHQFPQVSRLSGSAVLRMATVYELRCPAGLGASSTISFRYRDSISSAIGVTQTSATTLIRSALLGMADLSAEEWDFDLTVQAVRARGYADGNTVCDASEDTRIRITLRSDYGNINGLDLLDTVVFTAAGTSAGVLTWTSNTGKGQEYECSRNGICQRSTGTCVCAQSGDSYRMISSDGAGAVGENGDCGFVATPISACPGEDPTTICSGHGYCDAGTNAASACLCFGGWHGIDCAYKDCPVGLAWFDEPISSSEAHLPAQCSNMGTCDHSKGQCKCRLGWSGAACDIMECPLDLNTGEPCSGNGWCMNLAKQAELSGFAYGSTANARTYPGDWDALKVRSCVCSADVPGGYVGHPGTRTVSYSIYTYNAMLSSIAHMSF
jgi:hypothetical protein